MLLIIFSTLKVYREYAELHKHGQGIMESRREILYKFRLKISFLPLLINGVKKSTVELREGKEIAPSHVREADSELTHEILSPFFVVKPFLISYPSNWKD